MWQADWKRSGNTCLIEMSAVGGKEIGPSGVIDGNDFRNGSRSYLANAFWRLDMTSRITSSSRSMRDRKSGNAWLVPTWMDQIIQIGQIIQIRTGDRCDQTNSSDLMAQWVLCGTRSYVDGLYIGSIGYLPSINGGCLQRTWLRLVQVDIFFCWFSAY